MMLDCPTYLTVALRCWWWGTLHCHAHHMGSRLLGWPLHALLLAQRVRGPDSMTNSPSTTAPPTTTQTMEFARQLWAGRDEAPYFLKVRSRPALDACASGGGDAAAAAASVWAELLQQNWRVQLDAGLGSAAPESEALLLVCTPQAVLQLLAAAGAAPSSDSSSSAAGAVSLLEVAGTQAGEPLDWQLLSKRLVLNGVAPSSGDAIAAALSQSAVAAQAQ